MIKHTAIGLILSVLGWPAWAEIAVNPADVRDCFETNPEAHHHCLSVVLHPCAEADGARAGRVCLHRLQKQWDEVADDAESQVLMQASDDMQRWIRLRSPVWRETLTRNCQDVWIDLAAPATRDVQSACELLQTASWHYRMSDGDALLNDDYAALRADVESMEACVLETAHVGEEVSCTGLIAEGCTDEETGLRACLTEETLVWNVIAQSVLAYEADDEDQGQLRDMPSRSRGHHVVGCGKDDGSNHFAQCQLRTAARVAGELFLDAEGN